MPVSPKREVFALFERDTELAVGDAARAQALEGRGSLVVVEGTAGIGKTRLVAAMTDSALAAGMIVLRAHGGELERGFPYGVVRQLFEVPLARLTGKKRASVLSGAASTAGAVLDLGDDGNARRKAGGDVQESFAVVHGLYWLTANLASGSPLAIVVDDAHWADGPSLRFLAYLARRLDELPILLVLATRPNEPESERALIRQMAAAGTPRLLRPGALSERAVGELLQQELSAHPDERFVAACHEATAGNPFYLSELAAALRDDHIEPTAEAAAGIRDVRPETLSRSILLRLARLTPEAEALAQAVAVLGDAAELAHAAQLVRLDLDAATGAADDLARADILTRERPLGFVHAIVREAVHADIPASERASRHAAAARLLAAASGSSDQITEHLLLADPIGDSWVVEALRRSAREALSRGAPTIAVQRLRRALAEPPDADHRPAVLVELARAELRTGETASTVEHCRDALESESDLRARVRIAVLMRTALVLSGRPIEAVQVLESLLEEVSDTDLDLTVLLETATITAAGPTIETASVVMRSPLPARVIAGETDDPWATSVVATHYAARGERPAEEMGVLAERAAGSWLTGDYEGRANSPPVQAVLQPLVQGLILNERFAVADKVLDRARHNARERGWLPELLQALAYGASSFHRQGRLGDAEADARAGIALSEEHGEQHYAFHTHATLLLTLIDGGAIADARAALDRSPVDELAASGHVHATWLLHARGRLRCAEAAFAAGLEDFVEAGARFSPMMLCPTIAPWRSDAALAHLALGDADSAMPLVDDELERARAFGAPRALGIALRVAGLLRGGEAGLQVLEESVAVLADSAARVEHARALVDLGAAMRRLGRRSEARVPLQTGRELAHAHGAAPIANTALDELRATGARPRALMVTGRDALTASEGRIAALAADGLANREIAQTLFVTSRTVENHLARIYQKLDIHSRKELAGALVAQRA